jgi:hypothetical protein
MGLDALPFSTAHTHTRTRARAHTHTLINPSANHIPNYHTNHKLNPYLLRPKPLVRVLCSLWVSPFLSCSHVVIHVTTKFSFYISIKPCSYLTTNAVSRLALKSCSYLTTNVVSTLALKSCSYLTTNVVSTLALKSCSYLTANANLLLSYA